MAVIQGIAFRSTLGYVTDGANEYAQVVSTTNYPTTTSQGLDVGYETINSSAPTRTNQSTSNDVRIAGDHYFNSADTNTYRIDLPAAGDYDIRLGAGEDGYGTSQTIEVYDTTTLRSTVATNTSSGNFADATNTDYSRANWGGSETAITDTFTTTICRFDLVAVSSECTICYLSIEQLLSRDQKSFQFYEDGTESGATSLAAIDTDITIAKATPFQERVGMQTSGDAPSETATLQYKETSDATTEWRDVPN